MMIDANNLLFFSCTVATIMATLGALIGSFSVFRLQNIDAEIDLLKGIILDRPFNETGSTLRMHLNFEKYHFIRKIYDLNLESVNLLREQATVLGALRFNSAFSEDLENIENNIRHAFQVKTLNRICFIFAAIVILTTQSIAIGANYIIKFEFGVYSCVFVFCLLTIGLWLFEKQLRNLIN